VTARPDRDLVRGSTSGLVRGLAAIFSFEAIFAAFINAGHFKGAPEFAWVPVDLTALTFALSVLAALVILGTRGLRVPRGALPILAFGLAFVLYVVASLMWTPSRVYGLQKAEFVGVLTLWAFVGPAVVIAGETRRMRRFLVFLLAFAVWVGIDVAERYAHTSGPSFIPVLGSTYLGVGRAIGVGSAIALTGALARRLHPLARAAAALLYAVLLYLLLVVGGRGPFLATLIASLVPLVLAIRLPAPGVLAVRRYLPWMLAALVVVAASVTVLATGPNPPQTLRRLEFAGSAAMGGSSVATRSSWDFSSLRLWSQRPLVGHGVGSWPVLMGFTDARAYTHDIVLEVLVEYGAIGLLLLGGMFVTAVGNLGPWRSLRFDAWRVLLLMLFVNTLVNALISGDLSDNRMLFTVAGMMAFGARGSR